MANRSDGGTRATTTEAIPFTCAIESSYNVQNHTEYSLRVHSSSSVKDNSWLVSKRYSDFTSLDDLLKSCGVTITPSLPPKKVFGRLDDEFVAERLKGLQAYLVQMLKHPWVCNSLEVRAFLSPSVYSNLGLEETAMQNISMFLRSEDRWEVLQPLPHVGWRIRKCLFLVKDRTRPKEKFVLTWCSIDAGCTLDSEELLKTMNVLTSLQHPYIEPTEFATSNNSCVVVIRRFHESGSLRDAICNAKPSSHFLRKYATSSSSSAPVVRPVQGRDIQAFGRQLLEAVSFLREKDFPYIHIHAGNVGVVGGRVQLWDVENSLTAVPSLHRCLYVRLRKLKTIEACEVYCFGHLLYELMTGVRLYETNCDTMPKGCPSDLWPLLESILSTSASKAGLPTIADLLRHPFLSGPSGSPQPGGPPAGHCKVGGKLREAFKRSRAACELRLREEQRALHQHQCLAKAQAFHMSEEEKKKRRLQKVRSMNEQDAESPIEPMRSLVVSTPTVSSETRKMESNDHPLVNHSVPVPPPPMAPPIVPLNESANGNVGRVDVVKTEPSEGRGSLLASITSFKKSALKKAKN